MLLKLRKLLLERLGIVAGFAGKLFQVVGALGFFGLQALFEAGETFLVFAHVGTKQNVPDFIDVCAFAQFPIGGVFLSGSADIVARPPSAMNRLPGQAGTLLLADGVGNMGCYEAGERGDGEEFGFLWPSTTVSTHPETSGSRFSAPLLESERRDRNRVPRW